MLKRVTDSDTENGVLGRSSIFRKQRVLPVHKNCSLDICGDLQLPVERPCLWNGITLDLGSDIPC
jgi:hypothetical protein